MGPDPEGILRFTIFLNGKNEAIILPWKYRLIASVAPGSHPMVEEVKFLKELDRKLSLIGSSYSISGDVNEGRHGVRIPYLCIKTLANDSIELRVNFFDACCNQWEKGCSHSIVAASQSRYQHGQQGE